MRMVNDDTPTYPNFDMFDGDAFNSFLKNDILIVLGLNRLSVGN